MHLCTNAAFLEVLIHKRAFNLLGGVNQGRGLLLARGLEKRQPGALVNTTEKIEYFWIFLNISSQGYLKLLYLGLVFSIEIYGKLQVVYFLALELKKR